MRIDFAPGAGGPGAAPEGREPCIIPWRPPRRRAFSLTPLVDVMFNLLFFFMLASSYAAWQEIALDLGGGAQAPAAAPAWELRVLSPARLELNGVPVDLAQAGARLHAAPAGTRVVVQPAPGVSLQILVDVLDALRPSGSALLIGRPPAS